MEKQDQRTDKEIDVDTSKVSGKRQQVGVLPLEEDKPRPRKV